MRSIHEFPNVVKQAHENLHVAHAYQAAMSLYLSVRPTGGLNWLDLSAGQRAQYHRLIEHAQVQTECHASAVQYATQGDPRDRR